MDATRLDRLTEQQRVCLRFVYSHMTSKEIAPRLGIEPGSVDQHIKAAMRVLGVSDRRAAARMLVEHEHSGAQPLVYQSPDVAIGPDPATLAASTESGWQHGRTATVAAMHEDQSGFGVSPYDRPRGFQLPLPIRGGRPGDLGSLQRLGWIFAIMLLIALSFGVFMAGVEALSRLGRALV